MKTVTLTCRRGTPKRAVVVDHQTGEKFVTGTTATINYRHPWSLNPRISVEIDSPHIGVHEELTIHIEHEESVKHG